MRWKEKDDDERCTQKSLEIRNEKQKFLSSIYLRRGGMICVARIGEEVDRSGICRNGKSVSVFYWDWLLDIHARQKNSEWHEFDLIKFVTSFLALRCVGLFLLLFLCLSSSCAPRKTVFHIRTDKTTQWETKKWIKNRENRNERWRERIGSSAQFIHICVCI